MKKSRKGATETGLRQVMSFSISILDLTPFTQRRSIEMCTCFVQFLLFTCKSALSMLS